MSGSGRNARLAVVIGSVVLAAGVVAGVYYFTRPAKPVVQTPATVPATKVASNAPATTRTAASGPSAPRTFVELVKLSYPDCPATRPLETPLDRKNTAHLLLRDAMYLDRSGHVWITRADAAAAMPQLARAGKESEHLVAERPVYVHWRYEPGTRRNDPGHSTPVLVCPAADGKSIAFIDETKRFEAAPKLSGYHWADAFSWEDNIVVGSATGASVSREPSRGGTKRHRRRWRISTRLTHRRRFR